MGDEHQVPETLFSHLHCCTSTEHLNSFSHYSFQGVLSNPHSDSLLPHSSSSRIFRFFFFLDCTSALSLAPSLPRSLDPSPTPPSLFPSPSSSSLPALSQTFQLTLAPLLLKVSLSTQPHSDSLSPSLLLALCLSELHPLSWGLAPPSASPPRIYFLQMPIQVHLIEVRSSQLLFFFPAFLPVGPYCFSSLTSELESEARSDKGGRA